MLPNNFIKNMVLDVMKNDFHVFAALYLFIICP